MSKWLAISVILVDLSFLQPTALSFCAISSFCLNQASALSCPSLEQPKRIPPRISGHPAAGTAAGRRAHPGRGFQASELLWAQPDNTFSTLCLGTHTSHLLPWVSPEGRQLWQMGGVNCWINPCLSENLLASVIQHLWRSPLRLSNQPVASCSQINTILLYLLPFLSPHPPFFLIAAFWDFTLPMKRYQWSFVCLGDPWRQLFFVH